MEVCDKGLPSPTPRENEGEYTTLDTRKSLSRNVIFHTHSSHISGLGPAPYSRHRDAIDNTSIRTSGRVLAQTRNLQQEARPESAGRQLQKRSSAAVRATIVSTCRPNSPSLLMQRQGCSGESAERPSHMSVTHLNAILINAKQHFSIMIGLGWLMLLSTLRIVSHLTCNVWSDTCRILCSGSR